MYSDLRILAFTHATWKTCVLLLFPVVRSSYKMSKRGAFLFLIPTFLDLPSWAFNTLVRKCKHLDLWGCDQKVWKHRFLFFFIFTQHFFNLSLRDSLFSLKSELAQEQWQSSLTSGSLCRVCCDVPEFGSQLRSEFFLALHWHLYLNKREGCLQ